MERTWKHTLFACIAAAVLVATLLLVGGKLIEKTSDTPAGTQQTEENTQQQEQTGSEMPSADPNDPSIIGGNTVTTDVGQQDRYQTDPVPEGRPDPVEPDEADIDDGITYTCTFSISCETILDNWELCDESKKPLVPSDGVILSSTIVSFSEGESVFDVLQRICKDNTIHRESSWTPRYNSAYIEGINNLYEFDVGEGSGWMYSVNGWYPNYGCSRYQLQDGDIVAWRYTCDYGADVGGGYTTGS